jgi:hypothetical protein
MSDSLNQRAVIGANFPPPDSPFEDASRRVNDVYEEAASWLNGERVQDQETANGIANLIALIGKAWDVAETARKAEKKPFDDGANAVQDKYLPLLKRAELAKQACKKALQPWLQKLADEIEAKARAARDEADRKRREAEAAIRKAAPENLTERAAAEALIVGAKHAETVARKAETTTAKAGGTFGRATGLRSVYTPVLTDARKAMTAYWATNKDEILQFVESLAQRDVRNGKREIPGFRIDETKVPV